MVKLSPMKCGYFTLYNSPLTVFCQKGTLDYSLFPGISVVCSVSKKKFVTPPKFFLFPSFLLLLAFSLRVCCLDIQSIWWDEGHSIQMASASLTQIPTLPGMDVHPPGFFAALHLWMDAAGRSEFALRYLSVAFSVLTAALLIRFGREMINRRAGLWAGFLAAISPFYIAYAQEVRMYAMVTFFAAVSVYALWKLLCFGFRVSGFGFQVSGFRFRVSGFGFRVSGFRFQVLGFWGWFALYVVATTAALYTHYFTLFLLAFENLAWLAFSFRRSAVSGQLSAFSGQRSAVSGQQSLVTRPSSFVLRPSSFVLWALSQAVILLLFAPQLLLAARQIGGYANPNLQPPSLLHYITHNWQAYTLGLTIDPTSVKPYLWALAAILLLGLFLVIRHSSFVIRHSSFLLAWLLIPLALYFIVLQQRPSYEPRYMMLVTPALFLLFGLAFSGKGWLSTLLGAATALMMLWGLRSYYTDETFFKDDAKAVTQWLAAESTPADIVYVDVPHPFHYYADRIPAPTRYLFVDIHTAADTLNKQALGKNRLYWITWWGSDTDPRGVISYLLRKQAGLPTEEKQFRGYRVERYTLSERPFSLPDELPSAEVNFDNVLLLDGLAYSKTLSPGEAAWVTLHFTQLSPTTINYKVSLRLRAPDGSLLAQVDKAILNDRHFQTAAWPIEDPALNQAINVYTLPLNQPNYTGPLTLEAVVYNAATGDSIAAYGVSTTNDDLVSAQIGEITMNNEQ